MKHLCGGGTNVYINNPGHITKMATMPIYGKNRSDFNETLHEALMTQVLQCVYKL